MPSLSFTIAPAFAGHWPVRAANERPARGGRDVELKTQVPSSKLDTKKPELRRHDVRSKMELEKGRSNRNYRLWLHPGPLIKSW